jgi:hypothetical protein
VYLKLMKANRRAFSYPGARSYILLSLDQPVEVPVVELKRQGEMIRVATISPEADGHASVRSIYLGNNYNEQNSRRTTCQIRWSAARKGTFSIRPNTTLVLGARCHQIALGKSGKDPPSRASGSMAAAGGPGAGAKPGATRRLGQDAAVGW